MNAVRRVWQIITTKTNKNKQSISIWEEDYSLTYYMIRGIVWVFMGVVDIKDKY